MSPDRGGIGKRLRVIPPGDQDRGTAPTPGLGRKTVIDAKSVGARTLWVGHVQATPGVASGVHHHGHSETGVCVIRGSLRFRFGKGLAETVQAHAGDFIFMPPHTVQQEMNPDPSEAGGRNQDSRDLEASAWRLQGSSLGNNA